MTAHLGIGVGPSDPAAGLVVDGHLVAFAEEERLIRRKHAVGEYPLRAVEFVLGRGGVALRDVDGIIVGWDLDAYTDGTMGGVFERLRSAYDVDARTVAWQEDCLHRFHREHHTEYHHGALAAHFGPVPLPPVWGVPHHEAHAYHAAADSGFARALVVTLDGSGDDLCTSLWQWNDDELTNIYATPIPHSLGWFYAAVTEFLGFQAYDGEYKVMGLSGLGRPSHLEERLEAVVSASPQRPGYTLDPAYIHYGEHSFSSRFTDALPDLLRRAPRRPEEPVDQWHADLALAAQQVVERCVGRLVEWGLERTGARSVCFGGGVAHNVAMVGAMRERFRLDAVFAHPLSGDAGVGVGAALRHARRWGAGLPGALGSLALGPEINDAVARRELRAAGLDPVAVAPDFSDVAALLASGNVIAWCRGRMEAGPRALGQRSILADPRDTSARERLNGVIKTREPWQPFAPALPRERAGEFLTAAPDSSPYMTCIFRATPSLREVAPAVVHVDGTARAQLVEREHSPDFHALLRTFGAQTEVPVLLNTSLNRRGEPIACSERDAIAIFCGTDLDALVLGNQLVVKP